MRICRKTSIEHPEAAIRLPPLFFSYWTSCLTAVLGVRNQRNQRTGNGWLQLKLRCANKPHVGRFEACSSNAMVGETANSVRS
jgi:hypothetical protein